MIIDKIENLALYAAINPLFGEVVNFLKNTDFSTLNPGKTVLNGDDLVLNYNVCKGKKEEEAKLETHDKMIDIQIPLNAVEVMGYTPRADLEKCEYNAEKDITFYEGRAQQYFSVAPGMFAIFFPEDGHAPAISEAEELRKFVFKVKF